MNIDTYIKLLRDEISSGLKIRSDARINQEGLEILLKDTSIAIGESVFETNVITPLSNLTPYVHSQYRTTVALMKFFLRLDNDEKMAYCIKVEEILKEKLWIAQNNSKRIKDYKIPLEILQKELFAAYKEISQRYKTHHNAELKELDRMMRRGG